MYMSSSRKTSIAAAFIFTLIAFSAGAVPLGVSPGSPPGAPSLPYAAVNDSAALQEVVSLLNRGERKEAKIKLGRRFLFDVW
jgi:hypothetical protein